jgi:hypothetical protein
VKLAHKMIGDSGLTDKERSAFEDKLLILQAELEGYKAALKRAEAKESKELIDQAVGPASGCVTDPVLVVIRRDTEAAVEGFMVDIGESPSKNFSSRKSKEARCLTIMMLTGLVPFVHDMEIHGIPDQHFQMDQLKALLRG